MKVYSVLIVSVTLFVFYNLAVFQENFAETKNYVKNDVLASHYDADRSGDKDKSSQCYVSNIKITDKEYYEAHHVGQDDFALQVSGKDHQYLNTGVSLIYENSAHEGTNEQHVVILSGLDSENAEFDNDQDTDRHAYFEGSIDENFKKTSGHKEDSSLHPHVWE